MALTASGASIHHCDNMIGCCQVARADWLVIIRLENLKKDVAQFLSYLYMCLHDGNECNSIRSRFEIRTDITNRAKKRR